MMTPSVMLNLQRHIGPDHTFTRSKGGHPIITANGLRIMCRKFRVPATNGVDAYRGVWKFICFDVNTGQEVKRNLEFWEALEFIKGYES